MWDFGATTLPVGGTGVGVVDPARRDCAEGQVQTGPLPKPDEF
jgi:hypothetical protein